MNTVTQTKFSNNQLGHILARVCPKLSDEAKAVAFCKISGETWINHMIQEHAQEYYESDAIDATPKQFIDFIVESVEFEANVRGSN